MEQLLTAALALAKTIVFFPPSCLLLWFIMWLAAVASEARLETFGLEAEIRALKLHRKINCD